MADSPFGAHDIAAPDADLSPPGAAALLADFLSELGIDDAGIMANDTGGAITQILLARHPEMVGRVVLTSSDAFERFPPAAFSFLPALTGTARQLFTENGYAHVSADQVVRAANMTRGALYHHYGGKQDLFRDVFEQLEAEVSEEVADAARQAGDPWTAMVTALGLFLDICQRPEVLRIALIDAPAVLGWQEWREIEARHALALITELLDSAERSGSLAPVPVPSLAQLILSAVIEAALMIAHADDPAAVRPGVEQSLLRMLSGIVVQ